jgi:hypothetical protein
MASVGFMVPAGFGRQVFGFHHSSHLIPGQIVDALSSSYLGPLHAFTAPPIANISSPALLAAGGGAEDRGASGEGGPAEIGVAQDHLDIGAPRYHGLHIAKQV